MKRASASGRLSSETGAGGGPSSPQLRPARRCLLLAPAVLLPHNPGPFSGPEAWGSAKVPILGSVETPLPGGPGSRRAPARRQAPPQAGRGGAGLLRAGVHLRPGRTGRTGRLGTRRLKPSGSLARLSLTAFST